MLDPHIRSFIKKSTTGKPRHAHAALYDLTVRLPDVYGVFTFKVDYMRRGKTYLLQKDVLSIRQLRHDQYPRFISQASPYYASYLSVVVVWLVFCAIWLFQTVSMKQTKEKAT